MDFELLTMGLDESLLCIVWVQAQPSDYLFLERLDHLACVSHKEIASSSNALRVMLLEHEGYYGLGMDALMTVCCWNTNVIIVWALML